MAHASFQVICPNCRRLQRLAHDSSSGPMVSCPECQQAFERPERIHLACPACSRELKIKTEYLGRAAACKFCSQAFTLSGNLQIPPTVPGSATPGDRAERDQFVARLEQYERELEEARSKLALLASISTERDVLAVEKERLQRQLDETASRLNALESERDTYSTERNKLAVEKECLQGQLDEIASRLSTLESELDTYRTGASEAEGLRERLAAAQTELDSARSTIAELAPESDRLRESLAAMQESLSESGKSQQAVAELLEALERANAERDRLRDEIQDLQSNLEHLRTETDQLDQLKRELEVLRTEHAELLARPAAPDAPATSEAELARLAQELDTLASERDRIRSQSKSSRDQAEQLWSENDRLQDLADQAERIKRDRDRIRVELEAAKTAIAETGPGSHDPEGLRAQIEAALKDRDVARHQASSLVQDRQALLSQRDQAEMARKAAEERYQQVVQRGNDIFQKAKQQLDQLSAKNKSLAEEVQHLRADLAQERQNGGARRREPALADFGRQHVAMAGLGNQPPPERGPAGPTVAIPLGGIQAPAAQAVASRSQREIIDELRFDLERKLSKVSNGAETAPDDPADSPAKKERTIQATDLALNALAAFDDIEF